MAARSWPAQHSERMIVNAQSRRVGVGMATAEQRTWIALVLGVHLPEAGDAAAAASLSVRELANQVTALRERATKLSRGEVFATDMRAVVTALQQSQLARARALIEELEARVTSAERAEAAAREIEAAVPKELGGIVAFAKLHLALNAALATRVTAAMNLQEACLAVLNSPDEVAPEIDEVGANVDDPVIKEARVAAAGAGDRLPPMDEVQKAVEIILDRLVNGSPDQRPDSARDANVAINAYLAKLDLEPMLRELQDFPAGTLPIYDALNDALTTLRDALAA